MSHEIAPTVTRNGSPARIVIPQLKKVCHTIKLVFTGAIAFQWPDPWVESLPSGKRTPSVDSMLLLRTQGAGAWLGPPDVEGARKWLLPIGFLVV